MTEIIRRVARNAAWLAAGEGAVKGALFLTAVIVAHGSGPAGMGTFSISYAAALVAVLILAAGQQEVVIREVAATPERARQLLTSARQYQTRLSAVAVPLAAAASLAVGEPGLRLSLLTFIPYALLRSVLVTHGAAFKGLDRMDMEVRARAIEVSIVLPLLAASALLNLEIWTAGLAFTAGAGAGLLWLSAKSRTLPSSKMGGDESRPIPHTGTPLWLELRREGLPFLALAVLAQLLVRVDTFLLAALEIPRPEIGFYGAAGAPVLGIVAVPQLLAMSFYPTLSRRAADRGGAVPAALWAALGGMVVGLALALFLYLIREPLITLAFGADFAPAVPVLARLIWILPATVTMTFLGTVLAAWHRQRWSLGVLTGILLLSISLNLMWIPKYELFGAASAAIWANWLGVAALLATTIVVIGRGEARS